jgi:small subunit ribosomal protein S13
MGMDLDGTKNVGCALTLIKGINIRLADAILKKINIPKEKRIGFLSDVEVRKIIEILNNFEEYNLPHWLLNRRKDFNTGKNIHLKTSDLILQVKDDVDRMKTMKSWRGYRHAYGLKVRGQRTKSTGRKSKSTGVKKKRGGTGGRS